MSQEAYSVFRDLLPFIAMAIGAPFALTAGAIVFRRPKLAIGLMVSAFFALAGLAYAEASLSRMKTRCAVYHQCPAGWSPNFLY